MQSSQDPAEPKIGKKKFLIDKTKYIKFNYKMYGTLNTLKKKKTKLISEN